MTTEVTPRFERPRPRDAHRSPAAALAALALLAGACAHGGRTGTSREGGAEVGLASFYAHVHQGRLTASGVRYDERGFTCAHRTLPFGTHLKVTDLETGRAVEVEVIDRGPFVDGRVVDLSRAAARKLGIIDRGVARVRVEPVD